MKAAAIDSHKLLLDLTALRDQILAKLDQLTWAVQQSDRSCLPCPPTQKVMLHICRQYGVRYEQLVSRSRTAHVVCARSVCSFFLTELFSLSSVQVGELLHRDHASVLNELRIVRDLCETQPKFAGKIETLRGQLHEMLSI